MLNHLTFLTLLLLQLPLLAQTVALPWVDKIANQETIKRIHTIKTIADVTVSDGSSYTASTIYHDPQRTIFQTVHVDHQDTYGVEGMYYWHYNGDMQKEVSIADRDITLGHQMHAQILFFDKLHSTISAGEDASFKGNIVIKYTSPDGWSMFVDKDNNPVGMTLAANDFLVTFTFSDFRTVQNVRLPFTIFIDDESRNFEYKFKTVLINQGTLDDLRPPLSKLTQEQQLLRLHRIAMDDHWFERTDGLKSLQADTLAYLSGGNVHIVSKEESGKTLDRIMSSRYHSSYNDLIRPIVKVSQDSTLGWVVARIQAKGVRLDDKGNETEPLNFVCSWIMLYEKINGDWKCIGNSSTFE